MLYIISTPWRPKCVVTAALIALSIVQERSYPKLAAFVGAGYAA